MKRRPRKPHLKRFIICLCLAPALVVAVAWGLPRTRVSWGQSQFGAVWTDRVPSVVATTLCRSQDLPEQTLVTGDSTSWVGHTRVIASVEDGQIIAHLSGVPFFAMWSYVAWPVPRTPETGLFERSLQLSLSDQFRFPLIPLWPGFIGNALLYAVVMWGVWTGFVAYRRRRRVRRGLCPACTYDLTGLASAECPECGETLSPAAGGLSRLTKMLRTGAQYPEFRAIVIEELGPLMEKFGFQEKEESHDGRVYSVSFFRSDVALLVSWDFMERYLECDLVKLLPGGGPLDDRLFAAAMSSRNWRGVHTLINRETTEALPVRLGHFPSADEFRAGLITWRRVIEAHAKELFENG